ncbi:hypothetical protein K431DRAFT_294796 [Polychaeton citri CBS 116435]|uniref:F-box domain-containing protein n=1 Tax=Polychaeton citri CBS 116435 TaxID=1314669 RepID=A0A9P4Q7G9_9PEZI|nr:hypothetical protein K431DRAFT_294796 [Polychaeton citri CBS 116435]
MAQDLPTELIELIFTNVSPSDNVTCAAVSQTNKLGYRAITPLWYQTVGISEEHLRHQHRQRKLHLLVRTLFENPRLAGYARTIRQDLYSGMGSILPYEEYGSDIPLEAFDQKLRIGLGLRTASGIGRFLCELVESEQLCNAWHFFVLMVICPNAEGMILTGDNSEMRSYNLFKDLVYAAQNAVRPCGLQKVSFVHLSHTFSDGVANIQDVLPLLRLPQLAELKVDSMGKCLYPAALLGYALQDDIRSKVESLSFLDFASTEDELVIVLASCTSLRALAVKWSETTATLDTFTFLCDRLLSSAKKLQFLRLECNAASQEDVRSRVVDAQIDERSQRNCNFQPIDTVQHLHNLKHLVITKNLLFGTTIYKRTDLAEVLPSSLEKLSLLSPDGILTERDKVLLASEELKGLNVEVVDGSTLSAGCDIWA